MRCIVVFIILFLITNQIYNSEWQIVLLRKGNYIDDVKITFVTPLEFLIAYLIKDKKLKRILSISKLDMTYY